MASSNGPNLGLLSGWVVGEGNWGPGMNDNLRKLDAIVCLAVLSATTAAPTVTTEGARYLVPASPTGAFAGQTGKIAVRVSAAWVFYAPLDGMATDARDTGRRWTYNGTAWVDATPKQPALDMSNPGAWTLPNGASFTRIQLFTKNLDTDNGWSAANNYYTAAVSGMYMMEAMLRPVRTGTGAMPANTNLSLGFGLAGLGAVDGIDVVSATSTDLLDFTVLLSKPVALLAGSVYHIYGKHSAATAIAFTYAQFRLFRISA